MENVFDKIFSDAVSQNFSIAGVILSIDRSINGSNYKFVKDNVARLNLNTSHWLGQRHGKSGPKITIPWESVLVDNSTYHLDSNRKGRLVKDGLLKYECSICHCMPVWNNKPLTLRLDHINGKNRDHRISNLRFLCPNCDSQLPTYCSKNRVYQRSINSIGSE